jgi:hypothetical protein
VSSLFDRIESLPVARIIAELETGTATESLTRTLGLAPRDILAALAAYALGDAESSGPTLVQQPPAHPRLAPALSEPAVSGLLSGLPRPHVLALAAGLLQMHDFWEMSHTAAQEADDLGEKDFSAYWHGIAHRREPDPGNAAYWFRRVGRHPIHQALAEAAEPILAGHGEGRLTSRLLGPGGWNSTVMIDLCTTARPGTPEERLARRLQRLEMQILTDATASG